MLHLQCAQSSTPSPPYAWVMKPFLQCHHTTSEGPSHFAFMVPFLYRKY